MQKYALKNKKHQFIVDKVRKNSYNYKQKSLRNKSIKVLKVKNMFHLKTVVDATLQFLFYLEFKMSKISFMISNAIFKDVIKLCKVLLSFL